MKNQIKLLVSTILVGCMFIYTVTHPEKYDTLASVFLGTVFLIGVIIVIPFKKS